MVTWDECGRWQIRIAVVHSKIAFLGVNSGTMASTLMRSLTNAAAVLWRDDFNYCENKTVFFPFWDSINIFLSLSKQNTVLVIDWTAADAFNVRFGNSILTILSICHCLCLSSWLTAIRLLFPLLFCQQKPHNVKWALMQFTMRSVMLRNRKIIDSQLRSGKWEKKKRFVAGELVHRFQWNIKHESAAVSFGNGSQWNRECNKAYPIRMHCSQNRYRKLYRLRCWKIFEADIIEYENCFSNFTVAPIWDYESRIWDVMNIRSVASMR